MTRFLKAVVVSVVFLAWAGTAGASLTPAQKCEKTKNKAAAKYGQCISTQRGKEIGGNIPDFTSCTTKLTDAFAKAEQKAIDAGSACPTTGDAAAVLARLNGVSDPDNALPKWFSNTRFVDNGNGTVSDTLTGLMWEKKDSLGGGANSSNPHDADNTYTWSTFTAPDGTAYTDFLDKLNNCTSIGGTSLTGGFAGHCDWRLPTIVELNSIVDLTAAGCGGGSPCIGAVFGPTQASFYWSSTTFAGAPGIAWGVYFADGSPYFGGKSSSGYVRGVRGAL
jgi:hypothetical protein